MNDKALESPKTTAGPYAAGTCFGWAAEYLDGERWRAVPVYQNGPIGIPYPIYNGGLLQHIGLMGYEQANAIAWSYAAQRIADDYATVEVRVVRHEIKYQIETRREEL